MPGDSGAQSAAEREDDEGLNKPGYSIKRLDGRPTAVFNVPC